MISSKKVSLLVVTLGLLVPLAAAASDTGSCISSMSASLDSAVLINSSGPTEVTVISSATPVVFVGDEGELKAEVGITIPDGSPTSFDHVRISLSNISFNSFAGCGTASGFPGNPTSLTDLTIEFDGEDEGGGAETVNPGPTQLEISFDPSAGLTPDGAGCFTGDFVTDAATLASAFEAELEDDAGEQEDLELSGAVTAVGSDTFDLDVNGDGTADNTIHTDASTRFEDPLTGLSSLGVGDLVEVEVVAQTDGTLLATKVELLFDEDGTGGATGRIACVEESTSSSSSLPTGPSAQQAASSFELVFAASSPDHPFPSTTVQVNLTGSTKFKVNKGNINTSGFVFNAANLAPGQRLTAAGTPVSGAAPPQMNATRLILKLQMLDGMLVDGSVNTGAGTFQINITSASHVLLTEPLTIKVLPNTRFVGRLRNMSRLNTTDTYRITGLLMRSSADGTITFLAKKVKKVTGSGM